jgi:hypothetical protein
MAIDDERPVQAGSLREPELIGAVDLVNADEITQMSPNHPTVDSAASPDTAASEAPPWDPSPSPATPAERPRFVAPASR